MILDTTFVGMNGIKANKKITSPAGLFKLPTDKVDSENKSLSGDAANDFMKTIVKQ